MKNRLDIKEQASLEQLFVVHYNDYFRGVGTEVVLILEAKDKEEALKKFGVEYLGWSAYEPELVDPEEREKFFFEGEVLTQIWKIAELVVEVQKHKFCILMEDREPHEE